MLFLGLASCSTKGTASPLFDSDPAELTPYLTPTPTETQIVKKSQLVTPTLLPTVTPTPRVYTIVEGDTMLAVAIRYGISLEDLQAANPDVNARLLVVGTDLVIPFGENAPPDPVTATPIPIDIEMTNCYSGLDGIWCFVSIKNDRARPLENISAQIVVYDDSGALLTQGTAIGGVNLLPPNEEFPLIVFFPGRFPPKIKTTAKVLTVQLSPKEDDRYINAWLEVDEITTSGGGDQAEISGRYGIPLKSQPGNLAWLLVVAYDSDGNVVGVRKEERFGRLEPGSSQKFNIGVFSLSSEISDVKAFVEVRP
jgi:murein DD-endopeptidase MepM/ murein hydrolase activator NlpD